MRELAQGVAGVNDDIGRLKFFAAGAAYEKCNTGFDWSGRGRILRHAIREATSRR
jgi:hypothetical protein